MFKMPLLVRHHKRRVESKAGRRSLGGPLLC
jgi:hypothetical protein